MKEETVRDLLAVNHNFYETFGTSFAATRRRIQPGVRRFLNEFAADGDWLDLGCGSGALGVEWSLSGFSGSYHGTDFSESLLTEARQLTAETRNPSFKISYSLADLLDENWDAAFPSSRFHGVSAFAVLHHIPGAHHRKRILEQAAKLLRQDGLFCCSVWQFQNSPKLMNRVIPWERVGIDEAALETGDLLLDWRAEQTGDRSRLGLRYVHLFSEAELIDLALSVGFKVQETFYSDGKSGNLALYLVAR